MNPSIFRASVRTHLEGRRKLRVEDPALVPAAVLLLLDLKDDDPHILFVKRTEGVAHHKGQFSFPGGTHEPSDGSLLETALREAEEEIGLPRDAVEIIGELDDILTRATRFVITPFVGLLRYAPPFAVDGREIEKIISVPVSSLLDPENFREEQWLHEETWHPVYFYDYQGDVIWGATARILKQFLDEVYTHIEREHP